jgi:hypothetical protein
MLYLEFKSSTTISCSFIKTFLKATPRVFQNFVPHNLILVADKMKITLKKVKPHSRMLIKGLYFFKKNSHAMMGQ